MENALPIEFADRRSTPWLSGVNIMGFSLRDIHQTVSLQHFPDRLSRHYLADKLGVQSQLEGVNQFALHDE